MKTTLLVLCLLLTTAAFGQYVNYLSSEPRSYSFPSHPEHASYTELATGQSIVGGTSYTIAQGERPVSDFPQAPQKSLGELARDQKKQHEHDKKARFVWEN